jgi:vancomycin resistance protein VanJ
VSSAPRALLARVAAGSLRVWLIAGILLRVTRLRDRFDPFAVVYYTAPWPVIAAGLAVLALHAARNGRRHVTRRYLILTGGALFTWFALSWNFASPSAEPHQLRVALWNAARPGPTRLPHLARWLRAQDADIIAIAEAQGKSWERDWLVHFPEYRGVHLPGEMFCLVRGEVRLREDGALDGGSYYALLRAQVRGLEITILQADLYGGPLRSRRRALARLHEVARAHASERLILLGDLNTPADSAHFAPFRKELKHVFETIGQGLPESWPMPLPVLTLDHLWSSPTLRPVACRTAYVWWSDHRPVVADFRAE